MPTKTELSKFSIRGGVTESAANTFTQLAVPTNIVGQGNAIFIATGLWMGLDPNGAQVALDGMWAHIAYSSQTAPLSPSDGDYIWGRRWSLGGVGIYEHVTYTDVDEFPIAQSQLWMGIQGSSLAQASTFQMKLEGYIKTVSTTDYFRIVNLR